MSDRIVMPIDTFNKLVDYVQKRPYAEVANLIDEIRNTAQLVKDSQVEEVEEASDEWICRVYDKGKVQ